MTTPEPEPSLEGSGDKGANYEDMVDYFSGKGNPHPISEGTSMLRALMLRSGFDELLTTYLIDAKDVRELLGGLHTSFKDAIYHLYTSRMAPVAPSRAVEVAISRKFPNIDLAQLWNILDDLDETSSGEELLVTVKHDLGLTMEEAQDLVNMIPELSGSGLQSTGMTLRAFMPVSWIHTAKAVYDERSLPLRLFTVGPMFRREPALDTTHMNTFTVLSIAVFDRDLTLEKGISVLKRLLSSLELEGISFRDKAYSYPFFETGTEYEIFVNDLEIGTCGMISQEVLESCGVGSSLFLADIGVERVLMHLHGYPDIRELFYPQFFSQWMMSDPDIASSVRYTHRPRTKAGREMAKAIERSLKALRGKDERGPMTVWRGQLLVHDDISELVSDGSPIPEGAGAIKAELLLEEAKDGMGLFGPGAFDQIWVKDGNIIGAPPSLTKEMRSSGALRTGKSYLRAFSNYAGWKVERSLSRGSTSKSFEMVRRLEDMNMHLTSKAQNYVLSRSRKVDVKGPVFLRFRFLLGSRPQSG